MLNLIPFCRSLKKNKGYFILSIVGISTALAAFIYILAYTIHERSYDTHFANHENIYRVAWHSRDASTNEYRTKNATSFMGFTLIQNEVPGIKAATGLFRTQGIMTVNDNNFNEERLFYTGAHYFDVFKDRIKEGQAADLDKPGTIFLSESTARKYFGDHAIGKRIRFRDVGFGGVMYDFEVRGILFDYPVTTHLKVNALLSLVDLQRESIVIMGNVPDREWRWAAFFNYAVLEDGVNVGQVQEKLTTAIRQKRQRWDKNSQSVTDLVLQPVSSIYLQSSLSAELEPGGNGKLLGYLVVVAFFVLALGWLNYISLTMANLISRAKEVGVKKLMGSNKPQIFFQALTETLFVNLLALLMAIGLLFAFRDFFTGLLDKDIFSSLSVYWPYVPSAALMFLIASLATGIYPGLILAGFDAKLVMKSTFNNTQKGQWLRKVMVGIQYVVVICLVSNLTIFFFQVRHMQSLDLGVNVDNKIRIQVPWRDNRNTTYISQYSAFEKSLQQLSFVKAVTASSAVPGLAIQWRTGANHQSDVNKAADIYRVSVRDNYFDFFDINMVSGKALNPQAVREVIVNQRTLEMFGLKPDQTSLNETLVFHSGDTLLIVGIIDDYFHRSPQYEMLPLAFQYSPTGGNHVSLAITGSISPDKMQQVERVYKASFDGFPFNYALIDEEFDKQYEADRRFGRIFIVFSGLAIIISVIGLVGLATYLANLRAKEFSIRKTMGATAWQIFSINIRYFSVILLVSLNIAIPISYFTAQSWLQDYAVKVSYNWLVFLLPLLMIVLVTLAAVTRQSLRVAWQNPIKNLRAD
jgi:putative ABC transport system permease protein